MKDRAAGTVMGALIGDALAVGPHWYYDLEELRRDYGEWITGYTEPKPHRYHAGLKAGQLSQAGIITAILLGSIVDNGGYDEADFCRRMDEELFPQLDGNPMSDPAATRANRSGKPGAGVSGKRSHGRRPAVMRIPPKLRSALSRWPRATPRIRPRWPARSSRIAC
jgi:ADP-ribosylglycohydrolase